MTTVSVTRTRVLGTEEEELEQVETKVQVDPEVVPFEIIEDIGVEVEVGAENLTDIGIAPEGAIVPIAAMGNMNMSARMKVLLPGPNLMTMTGDVPR
jgi:hypothetical protein